MLNTWINFILIAAIVSVPFYYQYWIRTRATVVLSEINSKASKLTLLTIGFLMASSFLGTHAKQESQTIVVFGACFLSVMMIFSFRSKAAQQIRQIELNAKEQFARSARSLGAFLSSIGVYYAIVYFLGRIIGTLPAVGVALVFVIATAPLMVRILFSCNRMYPSPLKEEILAIFKKAGVNIGEIYLMDTDKLKVSNALVCGSKYGFGPIQRSLFLTQNLFETLDTDELKAVICHEASHFQLHHIAKRGFSALFVIVLALLCVGLPIGMVAISIQSKEWVSGLAMVNLAANLAFQYTFIFKVIRRHEFEADLNAVTLGASPAALISALEKITDFNGASSVKEDWFTRIIMGNAHPSLEERKEAILSHQLPRSARLLPAPRFMVSYAMVVLVIGAWFVTANKDSLIENGPENNRIIASELKESGQ